MSLQILQNNICCNSSSHTGQKCVLSSVFLKMNIARISSLLNLEVHETKRKEAVKVSRSFHGTCEAVSGETADRENTGQSRIKPDHMQLAAHHIQQCFDPKRHLNKKNI